MQRPSNDIAACHRSTEVTEEAAGNLLLSHVTVYCSSRNHTQGKHRVREHTSASLTSVRAPASSRIFTTSNAPRHAARCSAVCPRNPRAVTVSLHGDESSLLCCSNSPARSYPSHLCPHRTPVSLHFQLALHRMQMAARNSANLPTLGNTSKSIAICPCPSHAASCNGVSPDFIVTLASAPFSRRI